MALHKSLIIIIIIIIIMVTRWIYHKSPVTHGQYNNRPPTAASTKHTAR